MSCDLPMATESEVWRPEELGWHSRGLCMVPSRSCVPGTWRAAAAEEYDWSFIVPLLSSPHQPLHTHIKEEEREANLICNREIFNHAKPKSSIRALKELELCPGLRNHLLVISQEAASRTRMAQSERASEDIRSEGTFVSSWLFKQNTETIEQRQTPRWGKMKSIYSSSILLLVEM